MGNYFANLKLFSGLKQYSISINSFLLYSFLILQYDKYDRFVSIFILESDKDFP